MNRARRAPSRAIGLLAVIVATGCAVLPALPEPVPTDVSGTTGAAPTPTRSGNLSPDGFDTAQRMAVRIRNIGCSSLSTGSGFAIDATTLITNRHVVADSADLQLSTYDGRDVAVTAVSTASLADLAVVRTAQRLPAAPELADQDPVIGDTVTVVGYPQGGQLTVTTGKVVEVTTDPMHESLGQVLVTDAPVEPGSSGSAALDAQGRVIGVVYAKDSAGASFVVPVSTVRRLLADDSAFAPSTSCS
jgi:S1-C subfamily serine protease